MRSPLLTPSSVLSARSLLDAFVKGRVVECQTLEADGRFIGRERRVALDQRAEIHCQSSVSPASYSASRPMRSRHNSAVHGSISEPHRLSR